MPRVNRGAPLFVPALVEKCCETPPLEPYGMMHIMPYGSADGCFIETSLSPLANIFPFGKARYNNLCCSIFHEPRVLHSKARRLSAPGLFDCPAKGNIKQRSLRILICGVMPRPVWSKFRVFQCCCGVGACRRRAHGHGRIRHVAGARGILPRRVRKEQQMS